MLTERIQKAKDRGMICLLRMKEHGFGQNPKKTEGQAAIIRRAKAFKSGL